MKKVLFLLFLSFIAGDEAWAKGNSAIWNGKADTKWYSDSKTEFTITTPEQLAGLAKLVNGGKDFYGKTVKLGANIMLNDTMDWQNWANKPPKNKWEPIGTYIYEIDERTPRFLQNPIGDYLIYWFVPEFIQKALRMESTDLSFKGTFDGCGFVISGVYINNNLKVYQGLFGYVDGELRNLGVRASYIKGGNVVGGLVGTSSSIVNCYSFVVVRAGISVGGLAGVADIIRGSYSIALVSGNGYVGGLAGVGDTISGSYSTGKVIGKGVIGGLVGSVQTIEDSYSTSAVLGDTIVGGLVGLGYGNRHRPEIINSYSIGAVTGRNEIGGLVGSMKNLLYYAF